MRTRNSKDNGTTTSSLCLYMDPTTETLVKPSPKPRELHTREMAKILKMKIYSKFLRKN